MSIAAICSNPGYLMPGESAAFRAKHALTVPATRTQRERLAIDAVVRVQTVVTDVPSLSASSEERSP